VIEAEEIEPHHLLSSARSASWLAKLARRNVACVVIGNHTGLLRGVDLTTEGVDLPLPHDARMLANVAGARV
jgi:hypothetical protein